jgi:hypothetical protein
MNVFFWKRANASVEERNGMVMIDLSEARAAQAERITAEQEAATELEQKRVAEALSPALYQLTSGDGSDAKFRRITSPQTMRDLNPLMHERMQQVCFFLAVTTPFGKRIVEIIRNYVVGDGYKVVCEDPAAQEIVDKFWADEINNLGKLSLEMANELTMFGELCLPVTVNPVDGSVRLGYIDPMNIDAIEYAKIAGPTADVEVSFPLNVRLRKQLGDSSDQQRRLSIIRTDEDVNSPSFGYLSGDAFYFAINKAKSASRGISELFSLADWIDVFDQMIFDFADKVRFLNAWIWHFSLEGANDKQVSDFRDKVTKDPPRQGGVQVTNDKVKIEAQTPEFKGADMNAGAEMVKKYGIGGAGLPDWFFADSGSGNRSTAAEMQGPTGKKLTERQNDEVNNLRTIVNFVLSQAKLHGALGQKVNTSYTIETPEMMVRDLTSAANTLTGATTSTAMAEDRGWIRGSTAARVFHLLVGQVGVVIEDSKEEYEAAQEELAEKDKRKQDALFPQQQLAQAINDSIQPGTAPAPGAVLPPGKSAAAIAADANAQG